MRFIKEHNYWIEKEIEDSMNKILKIYKSKTTNFIVFFDKDSRTQIKEWLKVIKGNRFNITENEKREIIEILNKKLNKINI